MTKFSYLLGVALLASSVTMAQKAKEEVPKNWHLLDKESSG